MPIYRDPFTKGRLVIRFKIEFPPNNWCSHENLKKLISLLPPKNVVDLHEDMEEVSLTKYGSVYFSSYQLINLSFFSVMIPRFDLISIQEMLMKKMMKIQDTHVACNVKLNDFDCRHIFSSLSSSQLYLRFRNNFFFDIFESVFKSGFFLVCKMKWIWLYINRYFQLF